MRKFLLFFLSLMTGCDAKPVVKGCTGGWVELTCEYPKIKYQSIEDTQKMTQSTQTYVWENKSRSTQYYDTKKRNFRVIINKLEKKDSGGTWCEFDQGYKSSSAMNVKLIVAGDDSCQGPFDQTAYRTAKTTITCDYRGHKKDSRVKFFCKENRSICEDILSTKSSLRSNGTFTLTETNSGFSMSISNVSSQHAGVYWCGVESNDGSNRASLRKIQLEVEDITNFTKYPTIGKNFSYWCGYQNSSPTKTKFICKGEDPSSCKRLVSTAQNTKINGKFSIKDDTNKQIITITMMNVTTEDNGTYWCGVESTDEGRSNPFLHRFVMTVVPPKPTPTFPVSSTQSTTSSSESHGDPQVAITVIASVSVLLLLLFGLILILIYKRHSKNKRNAAAAQHIQEDYIYEEIQQQPQKPDSGYAMNTIYVTANFPTNPYASLHYSTIGFQNSSGQDGGEALTTKPSSSACEYSNVKDSQSPNFSSVNQPSSEDPLYSTVYKSKVMLGPES